MVTVSELNVNGCDVRVDSGGRCREFLTDEL